MTSSGWAIRRALSEAWGQIRSATGGARDGRISTVQVQAPDVDPMDLLACASGGDCTGWFWRSPDRFEFAALGHTLEYTCNGADRFQALTRAWREHLLPVFPRGLLALCGFSFHPQGPYSEVWRPYPAGLVLLPRLLLSRSDSGTILTLALRGTEDPETVVREVDGWFRGPPPGREARSGVVASPTPEPDRWKDLVQRAANAIREGTLRKVVLARGLHLRAEHLHPLGVLRRLRARYPECTVFGVRRGGRWFVGATPERLLRVQGRSVEAMALAGSAPRGLSENEDRMLGVRLLESPKDREEHQIVAEFVRDRLRTFCRTIGSRGPLLLRTAAVQHLCTRIQGILCEDVPMLRLAGALHPTPAVAGVPLDEAFRWIAQEGVDRGWYSGALGWMDGRGEGELVVGIRSALVAESEAWVYAGCGILADSDPAAEYAESELKMQPLLWALGAASVDAVPGGARR